MCGRFDFHGEAIDVEAVFGIDAARLNAAPNYNVAPTHTSPVLVNGAPRLNLAQMRFGFKRPAAPGLVINARSETVSTTSMFREAYRNRRCAVLANGFFEWRLENGKKQPYYFRRSDKSIFAFAGLWQPGNSPSEPGNFVILTTTPNDVVKPYHDRMPVILVPDCVDAWVRTPAAEQAMLRSLTVPYAADIMEAFAVTPKVNKPANSSPENIEPLPHRNISAR